MISFGTPASFADRTITILNKPGSPGGGAASLTRNGDIWEIGLAIITVESGATIIEARNIRDIRMDSRYCGLAGLRWAQAGVVLGGFEGEVVCCSGRGVVRPFRGPFLR